MIYPPGFLIYAGVQGEEDGQEEGQETKWPELFPCTNKYSIGSHGYLSVFFSFLFYSRRNVTHLKEKKLLEKLKAVVTKT